MTDFQQRVEVAAKAFANTIMDIFRGYIDEVIQGRTGSAARGGAVAALSLPPKGKPGRKPGSGKGKKPAAKHAAAPAPAKAGKAPARGRRPGEKASDTAALAKQVVDAVKKQPLGRKALLAATKLSDAQLERAIAFARSAHALKIDGVKRNARYVPTGKALPSSLAFPPIRPPGIGPVRKMDPSPPRDPVAGRQRSKLSQRSDGALMSRTSLRHLGGARRGRPSHAPRRYPLELECG
jgi:hypothetical protein